MMSIMRCEKHNRHWDSDILEECPICEMDENSINKSADLDSLIRLIKLHGEDYEISAFEHLSLRCCILEDAINRIAHFGHDTESRLFGGDALRMREIAREALKLAKS